MNDPQRILVIRLSGVGDVLWTTPLLRSLRQGYPRAKIFYVVRQACAPVLENNPDVDELLVYRGGGPKHQLAFLQDIRSRRCHLCLDLVGTPRTAIQSLVSGAKVRMGFDFGYRRFFYNRVLSAAEANQGHEVEFHLYPLKFLGLEAGDRRLVFNLTPKEIDYRKNFWLERNLKRGREVVGIIPTGGWACKRWPEENYIALGQAFAQKKDIVFLIFWGNAQERHRAVRIAQGIGPQAVLAPETSLRQMAALISGCRAVVGNDTGPLHLATAFDIPVISFYGPTSPQAQGPWGQGHRVLRDETLPCLVCNRTDCRRPRCMENIKVDSAVQALRQALAQAEAK